MRYFITGATGFIGGTVARQLRDAGHDVVALVRNPERGKKLEAIGVSLHQGDIQDKESMKAAVEGVDGIFHIAAWYKIGVRHRSQAKAINVQGSRNVFELMKELEIPRGVYTSTLGVFSDTKGKLVDETYRTERADLSEYERTKWLAHYEVAEPMMKEGLPLMIVMPGAVYGPGDEGPMHDAMSMFLKRKMPAIPKGSQFCWAHVEDTARGHILAMEKGTPGETYIIAGPPHELADVMARCEAISGVRAPRLKLPPGAIRLTATIMGAVEKVIPVPETMAAETLRSAAGTTYIASNQKAKRELGYDPRELDEGLPETLLWEMEQLGMRPPGP